MKRPMTTKSRRIESLQGQVYRYYLIENEAKAQGKFFKRTRYFLARWSLMLYREYLIDDIKVRAESLSYLMLFSILPIIAGCFFIFTIFTQFGMVQEAIGSFVNNILDTIPYENRDVIEEYVLKFKDAYLASISGKSGKLGIFALAILIWVGLQTFNNIDLALNHIWRSDRDRPFIEKLRNFIVVSVGAPLVLAASLSIPLILQQIPATRSLFELLPFLSGLLNFVIPTLLTLGTFTMLYRFVPVTQVRWKSALIGSIFTSILLQIANEGMNIYFRIGTNTAYGKAAIIPLIGFWIYLIWIIIILGAEVSYLCQNEQYVVHQPAHSPTLLEVECLLAVVVELMKSYENGSNPVSFESLYQFTRLTPESLRKILNYLESNGWMLKTLPVTLNTDPGYSLARNVQGDRVSDLLKDFLIQNRPRAAENASTLIFEKSLETWIQQFESKIFGDFLVRQKTII